MVLPTNQMFLSFMEPVFSKVLDVIKCDAEVFLVLCQFQSKYYDSHYHSYSLSAEQGTIHILSVINLPYYPIFHVRRNFAQDGNKFLTFKYFDC